MPTAPSATWGVCCSCDTCEQRQDVARCAFGEEDSSRRCEDGGRVLEAQARGFLPGWEGRAGPSPRAVPLGRDADNEAPQRQARSPAAGTGSSSHTAPTSQVLLTLSFPGLVSSGRGWPTSSRAGMRTSVLSWGVSVTSPQSLTALQAPSLS